MKKSILLVIAIILLNLLAACGSDIATPELLPDEDQVATIVAGTISAIPTNTSQPMEVQFTPTATSFPGTSVTFEMVNLIVPPSVASGITGSIIPRTDGNDVAPWEIAPEHTQIDLDDYILQERQHPPQILVYPANEYVILQDTIANNIAQLNHIIENPNQQLTDEILPTHLVNAAQLFASNRKVITFQNGIGVRYLTQRAQYPAAINNHDLFYYFSGLTNDQKYYITAILPISMSALPENPQPGSPPIDLTGLDSSQMETALQEYYNNITALLDNTQADTFTPNLDLLDSLLSSLSIVE